MNTTPPIQLEQRLRSAARGFSYPRTPDVSRAVRLRISQRVLTAFSLRVRVAALVLAVLAAALAVPQVRAKLVEFFQIGVIRILPGLPTETPVLITTTPGVEVPLTVTPQSHVTPQTQPDHIISIAGLAGETTLAEARGRVLFPIRLPSYPSDLGLPDRVFVQADGPMVILVWLDEADPEKVRLSLHQIGSQGFYIEKYEPRVILETEVNGEYALWAEGPYMVSLTNGSQDFRRLVDGNTLIWKDGNITYRLESDLPLTEALKIAESVE
ncbi:MAG: hypothetical protein ACREUU_02935 [Gammaproteobacteria bacterium]